MKRIACSAAVVLTVALSAGACGKKRVEPPPAAPTTAPAPETRPTPPPPPPPPPAATPAAPTEEELFAKKTLEELNAEKPLADVYFGYDQTNLSDEARANLQKNLEWLKRWTSTKIMVEGHADARGTNEYNLALGERRASAVRAYLVSLGLSADRVTMVSKGEEQPFCGDETESCWQQNRRGHFIITAMSGRQRPTANRRYQTQKAGFRRPLLCPVGAGFSRLMWDVSASDARSLPPLFADPRRR